MRREPIELRREMGFFGVTCGRDILQQSSGLSIAGDETAYIASVEDNCLWVVERGG